METTTMETTQTDIKAVLESKGYKYHHCATRRGYTRVADRNKPIPYKGRYGEGYIVVTGQKIIAYGKKSTEYEYINYYIKEEK